MGSQPPRLAAAPSEGYFIFRRQHYPLVPVRMLKVADDWQPGHPPDPPAKGAAFRWLAIVNGEPQKKAYTTDKAEATVMDNLLDGELHRHEFTRVVLYAKKTTQEEYERLIEFRVWAEEHEPWHPILRPNDRINRAEIRRMEIEYRERMTNVYDC